MNVLITLFIVYGAVAVLVFGVSLIGYLISKGDPTVSDEEIRFWARNFLRFPVWPILFIKLLLIIRKDANA